MNLRFSVLVVVTVVILSVLTYVGWLISDQILYRQQAQPIAFPHDLHAGNRQIACQYCHRGVHAADSAGIPSVQECWDCHRAIPELLKNDSKDHPGIATLKAHYIGQPSASNPKPTLGHPNPQPIQWWKVYEIPDTVRFPHEAHIAHFEAFALKGETAPREGKMICAICHGKVWEMRVVTPANNPTMGWCVSCHRENNAPTDCTTCHK